MHTSNSFSHLLSGSSLSLLLSLQIGQLYHSMLPQNATIMQMTSGSHSAAFRKFNLQKYQKGVHRALAHHVWRCPHAHMHLLLDYARTRTKSSKAMANEQLGIQHNEWSGMLFLLLLWCVVDAMSLYCQH